MVFIVFGADFADLFVLNFRKPEVAFLLIEREVEIEGVTAVRRTNGDPKFTKTDMVDKDEDCLATEAVVEGLEQPDGTRVDLDPALLSDLQEVDQHLPAELGAAHAVELQLVGHEVSDGEAADHLLELVLVHALDYLDAVAHGLELQVAAEIGVVVAVQRQLVEFSQNRDDHFLVVNCKLLGVVHLVLYLRLGDRLFRRFNCNDRTQQTLLAFHQIFADVEHLWFEVQL